MPDAATTSAKLRGGWACRATPIYRVLCERPPGRGMCRGVPRCSSPSTRWRRSCRRRRPIPKRIPAFYKLLLESDLFILAPEVELGPGKHRALKPEEKINIATVMFNGRKWHPAFTSPKRISAYIKEPETCLGAKARSLFHLLPAGSNFWLNPQSECQKPLPGDEIKLLLSGRIFEMDLAKG